MPITVGGTSITFNDSTVQSTAFTGGGGANIQSFTSSGTYTKPSGANFVMVELWGGGAGGRGGHQGPYNNNNFQYGGVGGGGGAYVYKMFAAPQVGATEPVTVGAGGSAGPMYNGAGGAGGTTSFGTLLYSGGGVAPQSSTAASAGGVVAINNPGTVALSHCRLAPGPFSSNYRSFCIAGGGGALSPISYGQSFIRWSVFGGGPGGSVVSSPRFAGPSCEPYTYGKASLFGGGGGGSGASAEVYVPSPCSVQTYVSYNGIGGLGRIYGTKFPNTMNNYGEGGGGCKGSSNSTPAPVRNGAPGSVAFAGGGGGGAVTTFYCYCFPTPMPANRTGNGGTGNTASGGGGGGSVTTPGSYYPTILPGTGGQGGAGYAVVYSW